MPDLPQIWVATIEVSQIANRVGKEILHGAFTNGVAMAKDSKDAISQFSRLLEEMGFLAVDFEDIEPWEERFSDGAMPDDEVLLQAYHYTRTTGLAEFGEFFCY